MACDERRREERRRSVCTRSRMAAAGDASGSPAYPLGGNASSSSVRRAASLATRTSRVTLSGERICDPHAIQANHPAARWLNRAVRASDTPLAHMVVRRAARVARTWAAGRRGLTRDGTCRPLGGACWPLSGWGTRYLTSRFSASAAAGPARFDRFARTTSRTPVSGYQRTRATYPGSPPGCPTHRRVP